MTGQEMKQIIDEFKAEGKTDEEILDGCYYLYKKGDFNVDDLKVVAAFCGYELTEEFLNASDEDKKKFDEQDFVDDGGAEEAADDGQEKDQGGAAQEQPKSEGQEDAKAFPKEEQGENEKPKEENEEEERTRVRKELFGFDN